MSFKTQCNKITEVIISCWDENNPDDDLTFDERLKLKIETLNKNDKRVMNQIIRGY